MTLSSDPIFEIWEGHLGIFPETGWFDTEWPIWNYDPLAYL